MTEDITIRIRERLDNNGHEDWCPGRIHEMCCNGQCECAVGGLTTAIRAVLGLDRRMHLEGLPGDPHWASGWNSALAAVDGCIAAGLGISDSPAEAGSQPSTTAGEPIDWKQVAVKLGQLKSDWRLLSTPEAEALRELVDEAWDREQAARELRRDRARDEMGGGDVA